MNFSSKQIAIIGGLIVGIILIGVLIVTNLRSSSRPEPITLVAWGIPQEENSFNRAVEAYQKIHPNVKITYRAIEPERYREAVLNALAAREGPDIVMIKNRTLPMEKSKLAPVPATVFSLNRLKELFPTVVEQDFTDRDGIYALPRAIDTLALFYNKDRFDAVGITIPPRTWDEFQSYVTKLRTVNAAGQFVSRAAALGSTDRTTNTGSDLLALLMLQNEVTMTDLLGKVAFASERGVSTFAFYLQFANPASSVYTWSDAEPNAAEAFAAKQVAMIFGYKRDADMLRARNPFLNFGIAPTPQVAENDPISYADYWGYAVSKQSNSPAAAWDFIIFLGTDPAVTGDYINTTLVPPALREHISLTINDPSLSVFARQALTARSWKAIDDGVIRALLNAAIERVLKRGQSPRDALRETQDQINAK